jgi:hypothetical protein
MNPTVQRPERWRRGLATGALGALCLLGVAGCGKAVATTDVASLGTTPGTAPAAAPAADTEKKDPQDAMREFAACMREHGIDMPDPEPAANGKPGRVILGTGSGSKDTPIDKDKMDAANAACAPIMENVAQDPAHQLDPAEEAKMKEQALGFSKCMREHGIDMPDPQFGSGPGGGGMSVTIGGPGSEGKGPDPESPAFQDAQKACESFMPDGAVSSSDGGPNVAIGGGPSTQSDGESGSTGGGR